MSNAIYETRLKNLIELGFKSYAHYLRSPLWKRIRAKVFKRDKYLCRRCGKRAIQVHHVSYGIQTLSGKYTGRMYSVCKRCHDKLEYDHGVRRDGSEVIGFTGWLPVGTKAKGKQ